MPHGAEWHDGGSAGFMQFPGRFRTSNRHSLGFGIVTEVMKSKSTQPACSSEAGEKLVGNEVIRGVGVLPAVTLSPTSLSFRTLIVFTNSKYRYDPLNCARKLLEKQRSSTSFGFFRLSDVAAHQREDSPANLSLLPSDSSAPISHGVSYETPSQLNCVPSTDWFPAAAGSHCKRNAP